jgi:ubiquitin
MGNGQDLSIFDQTISNLMCRNLKGIDIEGAIASAVELEGKSRYRTLVGTNEPINAEDRLTQLRDCLASAYNHSMPVANQVMCAFGGDVEIAKQYMHLFGG